MRLFADELCGDLRFSEQTSAETFEGAVNALAWFIGIRGQRPERDYKEGQTICGRYRTNRSWS